MPHHVENNFSAPPEEREFSALVRVITNVHQTIEDYGLTAASAI